MFGDLRDVIRTFGPATAPGGLAVTRRGAGTWIDGFYTPGATSALTVTACVQPMTGRELMQVEEGLRTRELIVIHSIEPLQTVNEPGGYDADRVSFNGGTYEVHRVEAWPGGYRAIAVKVLA